MSSSCVVFLLLLVYHRLNGSMNWFVSYRVETKQILRAARLHSPPRSDACLSLSRKVLRYFSGGCSMDIPLCGCCILPYFRAKCNRFFDIQLWKYEIVKNYFVQEDELLRKGGRLLSCRRLAVSIASCNLSGAWVLSVRKVSASRFKAAFSFSDACNSV